MKTRSLILIAIFLLINIATQAQVKFVCSGKKFYISYFRKDSINQGFMEKQFEKMNFLQPIESSDYNFEIRGYYEVVAINLFSVITIKGNDHKLFAESYHYLLQKDKNDSVAPAGFQTLRWLNRNLYLSVRKMPLSSDFIDSLIKNKFFSQPGIEFLEDSLKRANVNIEPIRAFDPYQMRFEVKIGKQFRSFYCAPFEWGANKNIKEFEPEIRLFKLFDDLYLKTGQTGNHLFP